MLPDRHYTVPPLDRVDLDHVLDLIDDARYFALHAPRQTGKTSVLMALADLLETGGEYHCVYVNVEVGQSAREDVGVAMQAILSRNCLQSTVSQLATTSSTADGPPSSTRLAPTEAHLVLFDRTPERTWQEKAFHREQEANGRTVTVWGL